MKKPCIIKPISLFQSLIPVVLLMLLLALNVSIYGDDALSGSNQFILLIGGAIAAIVGFYNRISYKNILNKIGKNVQNTSEAILILLLVGALSGTWLLSGVIPSMVYYGLQILHPAIFLPSCVITCSIISVATGTSWTTSATVGIALVGIGASMDLNLAMVGGAIISGAYFGDKVSPLSDTTNLAAAMAGTDLFTHIKYTMKTTGTTYIITIILFIILGLTQNVTGETNISGTLSAIKESFNITPWLFIVPGFVLLLILVKVQPLVALFLGMLLGAVFALIFQPEIVAQIGGSKELNFTSAYKGVINAVTTDINISGSDEKLNNLFKAGGMAGMLNTVWLIICAMFFGGAMEAIGALRKLSEALLKLANSVFGLFASTTASCIVVNLTASDQYLSIVVPGKMFAEAFKEKKLAPENLSRTLEDAGTVTSVLIPWNTCGAYHAGVLGIPTFSYAPFAFFNIISPIMTLFFAAFKIKIKKLVT